MTKKSYFSCINILLSTHKSVMRKFTSPLGGFAVWFMNSLIEIRFFTISVCTFLQSNYCFRTDWRSSKINVTGLNCKFTLFTNISCPFLPISGHCEYFVTCFSKLNNDLSPRNLTTHLSTVFRDSQSYFEELFCLCILQTALVLL